jgi:hypothetical protein
MSSRHESPVKVHKFSPLERALMKLINDMIPDGDVDLLARAARMANERPIIRKAILGGLKG